VMENWRKLHNEKHSSQNIIRVIKLRRVRWEGHVACMDEIRNVYKYLLGKPEGKKTLVRPKQV
jgi:hypothetical protein